MKRNYSLDTLKGIAAIFVIFIHAQFPGSIGKYIAYLGTFAVPLFFMVSGYYNAFSSKEKLKRSIVRIMQLIAVTYILNIVRIVIIQSFSIYDIVNYFLENILSIKHLLMWLTLNTTLVSGVAWFLWALLYCYLGSYVFYSFYKNKHIYWIILLGFLCGGIVKLLMPLIGINGVSVNNWFFIGFPYYYCGIYINRNEKCLSVVNKAILVFGILFGVLVKTIGFMMNEGIGYISDILIVISLFTFCIKYPKINCTPLNLIGSIYAFFVYIMHPIVIHIFNTVMPVNNYMWEWFEPIIIVFITVILGKLYFDTKNRIISHREK